MEPSSNRHNVTADECERIVEEVISLISASGSIASGLVNAYVAREAIFMTALSYVMVAASFVLSVYSLMLTGNIMLFFIAATVLVLALTAIRKITQKLKNVVKESSIDYIKKAKGSLLIIEGLLNNRMEILESCLNECSGRLCNDIKELIEYYSGGTVSARVEQQS